MPERPTDIDELDKMFARVLDESNLGSNARMLAMKPDDKWKLIMAHARAEKNSEDPMAIIRRMEAMLERLDTTQGKVSLLKFMDKMMMDALKVSFRTASVSWLRTFVDHGGASMLVEVMRRVYPER